MRTHMRSIASPVILLAAASLALGLGCRKENEQEDAQYPQGQYPQQQYPQQQYPQQQHPAGNTYGGQPASTYGGQPGGAYPGGAQPATQPPPAGGVPCQTDMDPQCPFGRCINGKCGSCATADHCKPGAACMQTPVGMACVPAGMPGGGAPVQ